MLKGFRDFITRGNVIDLAVGVIMGGAFGAIVSSLVADIIMPIIGAIFGTPDYSSIVLGPIKIGNFINAILGFLFIAIGVYFFIVMPINEMRKRVQKPAEPAAVVDPPDLKLLAEIRDLLARQNR
jgi:large conductance mechanosensitive channel